MEAPLPGGAPIEAAQDPQPSALQTAVHVANDSAVIYELRGLPRILVDRVAGRHREILR